MKKFFILLAIFILAFFVFTGCEGIFTPLNGEEGEGEGEPEPVKQVVLVEAFVTDSCPNCAKAKPELEKLKNEFKDEMILVELIPWGSYSTTDAAQRFKWYSLDGVPKVFFNGSSLLSGSSVTYDAAKSRIQAQLALTPKISIQATRNTEGTTSTITGTVKNISSNTLSNLVINGMTFKKLGDFNYAVTKVFEDKKISIASLAAGESESFTITLPDINWDGMGYDGVIFVQSPSSKTIYQSLFIK